MVARARYENSILLFVIRPRSIRVGDLLDGACLKRPFSFFLACRNLWQPLGILNKTLFGATQAGRMDLRGLECSGIAHTMTTKVAIVLIGMFTVLLVPSVAAARQPPKGPPPNVVTLASLRGAAGVSFPASVSNVLTVDITGGVRVIFPRSRLVLLPEFGYTYDKPTQVAPHMLTAGFGIGRMSRNAMTTSWIPRLVASVSGDQRIGVRNEVMMDYGGLVTVSLAHQYLPVNSSRRHSYRITFGLDMGMLFNMFLAPPDLRAMHE